MKARNRAIILLVAVTIAALWLAACGEAATREPIFIVVTATMTDQPGSTPPTAAMLPTTVEALPTTAEPPTVAPPTTAPTETPAPSSTPSVVPSPTPSVVPSATASPVPTVEEPSFEDRTGPASLIGSYYNAINRREYARAWGYWDSPPNPTYEDFVQGFAGTASVFVAVRPPTWYGGAAGSMYARVPTLMSATHTDGSELNFVACFVTRYPNVEGPGVEQVWSLYDATVQPAPSNSTQATLLDGICDPSPETSYDDRTGPVRLLASYYNAINLGEYGRAWAYWETAPNPSYEDFVQGFADTDSVMLVVHPVVRLDGAAGSVYAAVPALMLARHSDSSQHNFVACFTTRRPNLGGEQEWSLYGATVEAAPGNSADVRLLSGACQTP